jgi:hypothetical protein
MVGGTARAAEPNADWSAVPLSLIDDLQDHLFPDPASRQGERPSSSETASARS